MRDNRDFTGRPKPPSHHAEIFGALLLIAMGVVIGFLAGMVWGIW